MAADVAFINEIVKNIIANMNMQGSFGGMHGVFPDMNRAIEASAKTQKAIRDMSFDQRERIISLIRLKTHENAELLSKMSVGETGMGNIGDKIIKHKLAADKVPGTEDLSTVAWSGDRGLTLVEMGPFGVIGAIIPSTAPSETAICNCIGMLAAGNTVVLCSHPEAAKTTAFTVNMINEASLEAGGPDNIAVTVETPGSEAREIMKKHPRIALLVATGGRETVRAALSSGKRAIGAGSGNPPVLVDTTADMEKAARDIINGCSFDNNLLSIAEKSVVAVDWTADRLINHMIEENGCYFADKTVLEKLTGKLLTPDGLVNRACVGKDAITLLSMVGVDASPDTKCIIFEGEREHPLVTKELMMPVLGILRCRDFDEAVALAVWLEQGNRHSAIIHSKNIDNITGFARAIDTAVLVKNAPGYAALGFGGEGYCSYTIASVTGEGLTGAGTFTRKRRCTMSDSLCIR